MRILFFIQPLGRIRHFKNVVRDLVEKGHTVVLASAQEPEAPQGFYAHPRIELASCPSERTDRWATIIDPLRRTRDYLRFYDPRYAHADRLALRAAKHAPEGWHRALEAGGWLRRHWRGVDRALALAETVIPCADAFRAFVRAQAPDVILVTPLVEFGSYQTDYVKCAHELGIRVCYLPFSWDNLTNRGLIRIAPDRILAWNRHQRREAIELHGMPADRLVITGAPRFDEFFAMAARGRVTARDEFCARAGLDASRPLLLYLCSAQFIAPREVAFVRRWVEALRQTPDDSWLHHASVLVRPHPANLHEWLSADLSDLAGVAVWAERSTMNADRGLFESLFHAAAVAGLNTSAMIEAAIVGRPVYSIETPEFEGGQRGTLHFHYLLAANGGVVTVGHGFEQHIAQLSSARDEIAATQERSRRFLADFVRPRGLHLPAAQAMVEEIERAAALPKRPRRQPLWHRPVRWALGAAVHAGFDPSLERQARRMSNA